jgi:hypothetical protein
MVERLQLHMIACGDVRKSAEKDVLKSHNEAAGKEVLRGESYSHRYFHW